MVISHTWKRLIIQTVIGNSQIESFAQFKYYTHICSAKLNYDCSYRSSTGQWLRHTSGFFYAHSFVSDIYAVSK